MTQLDRYIFRQLLGSFLFFLLIFTGIIWITQALEILDFIVESRQPVLVFLELGALRMPRVWTIALGVSGFSSAIYVTNRLYNEAELNVMMATGQSNMRLLRPFIALGVFVAILLSFNIHYLQPHASKYSVIRANEITQNYVIALIQPGRFVTARPNITMYFGNDTSEGELSNIFIEERIDDGNTVSYFAQSGQIHKDADVQKLIMFNGMIQQFNPQTEVINVVQFESYAYNLDLLRINKRTDSTHVNFYTTLQLHRALMQLPSNDPEYTNFLANLFNRYSEVLQVLIMPVLAACILLFGGYQRGGILLRILTAVAAGIGLDSFSDMTFGWVLGQTDLWYAQFIPFSMALLLCIFLIWNMDRPFYKLSRLEGT